MAIQYATFSQFTEVYCLPSVTSDQINTNLVRGSLRVNEELGGYFSTPFSSNNQTARDLSIDFAFLKFRLRTHNQLDSVEMNTNIDERLKGIIEGNLPMITDSGESIFASNLTKGEVWSNTETYKNTFDMREAVNQRVDPDLIDDLWDEDSA